MNQIRYTGPYLISNFDISRDQIQHKLHYMARKLRKILLIDDDETSNYMNNKIIEKTNSAEQIEIKMHGLEALDYLKTKVNGSYPKPELILLDISLPFMTGFEFIEEYDKLKDEMKAEALFMLTTSLNPRDYVNANENNTINEIVSKPLTAAVLTDLVNKYFKN